MKTGLLIPAVWKRTSTELLFMSLEVAAFALLYCWLSCNLTVELCPDERTRLQMPFWIIENGSLPIGTESLLRIKGYGFSYATSTYGPSMLAALFMRIVSFVSSDPAALVIAARVPSIIAGAGLVLACNGVGRRLFHSSAAGLMLALLICGLPQVVFLCSYQNNDAPSLFAATLIVYAWLFGRDNGWSFWSCVLLGISIGFCAMTYYFAFGFILMSVPVFFVSQLMRVRDGKCTHGEVWMGAACVALVALLIGGWFYIRFAIVLNGDFFGRATTAEMKNTYGIAQFHEGSGMTMAERGVSLFDMLFVPQGGRIYSWVVSTLRSLIGVFGNMNFPIGDGAFAAYAALLLFAIVGVLAVIKQKALRRTFAASFAASLVAVALSVFYSYTSEYQAQGRYVIVCLIPLGILVVAGLRAADQFVCKRLGKQDGINGLSIPHASAWMPISTCIAAAYIAVLALAIANPMASHLFTGVLNGYRFWWPYWY